MADVLLFHHALGLTEGVRAFADRLRAGGHHVTVPDLYDGATFMTVDEGVAHARAIGMDDIANRGVAMAEGLPRSLVYVGFSLGAMPAQKLAQSRPGALAALVLHSGIPPAAFGSPWPTGLPLQLHVMEDDAWGDVDDCREIARTVEEAELFLYPGAAHLFTDSSSSEYDEVAAELVLERCLALLDRVS
jgi:dienelactone hydrolase